MASCSDGEAEPTTAYSCEDWDDEYLVIEEAAAAVPCSSTNRKDTVAHLEEQASNTAVHCGSVDSGYEGRTCSPEVKTGQTTAAPQELEKAGVGSESEADEEWCIVEYGQGRPQGLYGYRYVDYDDEEAEGNIHITDEDL